MSSPLRQPMQAVPSSQQALPPQQNLFNQFNQQRNAFITRINSDPFIQRIKQQQQQLSFSLQQKQEGYVNSLQQFFNTAPPELKQFLSSPQVMQNLVTSYQRQQPEIRQLQNLGLQQNQYFQTNYGREQKRLQDLQMQFNQQRGPVKPDQPISNYNDPIVDPLRPSTTVSKTITPIERPPTQPIVDPKRESFTPDTPISDNKGMKVDPLKPIERLPVQPIVDPKRESFTPATPTSVDKGRVVDPSVPSGPPTITKQPLPNLIVDPKREPYTPPTPTSGLMPNSPKKRKAGMTPSQYSGVNTNVRGLMR